MRDSIIFQLLCMHAFLKLILCETWNLKLCQWTFFCYSVTQSCLTLCHPMDCSMSGFVVLHHLLELAQTHVHWVGDAIRPSHPLYPQSSCPPAPNPSQYQGLFQWVNSLHEVAKVLEFQLQNQSFQWTPRISFRMDWLDLLTVQGTLKSHLQHQISKASVPQPSAFFMVQLIKDGCTVHPYKTTGKIMNLTAADLCQQNDISAFQYSV